MGKETVWAVGKNVGVRVSKITLGIDDEIYAVVEHPDADNQPIFRLKGRRGVR